MNPALPNEWYYYRREKSLKEYGSGLAKLKARIGRAG